MNFGTQWVQEVLKFEFHQPVFKKGTYAGLNSLRQKGYRISVKNWISVMSVMLFGAVTFTKVELAGIPPLKWQQGSKTIQQ